VRRERVQRKRSAAAHEQGATIDVAQGAGRLARILGPIFATTTLYYTPPLPYLVCTTVLLATALIFTSKMRDGAAQRAVETTVG
jgi:hypothetical protein